MVHLVTLLEAAATCMMAGDLHTGWHTVEFTTREEFVEDTEEIFRHELTQPDDKTFCVAP